MPRNGAGTFSLAESPFIFDTIISETQVNSDLSDIANALTASISNDGQTPILSNLPLSGYKHTGVTATSGTSSRTEYQSTGTAQDGVTLDAGATGGTSTAYTATLTPAISAYADKQCFRVQFNAACGDNPTINFNSVGAKKLYKNVSGTATQLVTNDVPANFVAILRYDTALDSASGGFWVLNSFSIPTGSIGIASLADSTYGVSMANGTLVASVAANALTVAIKSLAGNDPSSSDPVKIYFRNVTAGTGDFTVLSLTSAYSLVVSSGSTLGTSDGVASTLWVVGFNDGGTFRLGIVNNSTVISLGDDVLASSTAEGGAGAADSAGVIYTGTAVTSKAMRILGYVQSTQATAGTWATSPSKVQLVSNIYNTVPQRPASLLNSGTAVASTSGTTITFLSIPSWVKRITVQFAGVSTSGTDVVKVRLGTSGGVVSSGYLGSANGSNYTDGFTDGLLGASIARHGQYIISNITGNTWVCSSVVGASGTTPSNPPGGFSIALGGTLDRVAITTTGGTDTFDAGTINIIYE